MFGRASGKVITSITPRAVYEDSCQVPSGVFSRRRGRSAPPRIRAVASLLCLPGVPLPPLSPHPRAGTAAATERFTSPAPCRDLCALAPVGRRVLGPGLTPGLPSIRGGPAAVPGTCYRVRLRRSARLLREPTHRTNGARPGSPGGRTAALPDLT